MKKYSWIKKVGKSLVPSEFYVHILQEPLYKAFLYMFLFIILLSTVTGSYIGYKQQRSMNLIVKDYNSGIIPAFKLSEKNGLWIEGNDVIKINHLDLPILMDDEGILNINDLMAYDEAIFFEKNRMLIKGNTGETLIVEYSTVQRYLDAMMIQEFDSDVHLELFDGLQLFSIPISILTLLTTSVFGFLYYGFIVLMIANILRSILGLELKLKQVYHMTIYAMTFPVFWTHFTLMLPNRLPATLDAFVQFAIPALILLSVFIHIRKRAVEEIQKKTTRK